MDLSAKEKCSYNTIKPINGSTVHKICSGQVVLNLAIAVKELVENSLDAGATIIDIKLKNYGIDLIEVSDNGSGVTEDNFQALTLKHHTSKLTDYSDLLDVSSFGFRGEALSSLCALSNVTITTRHLTAEYAYKLQFNHNGKIIERTACSRQAGTTVSLSHLFSSLPVRQKEFHKNAKREFNKMTQLLYAYCLISLGVKIICTNQLSSNSRRTVVATQAASTYKENIASVFGLKQIETLLELKPEYTPNIKDNILKGLANNSDKEHVNDQIDDVEIDLSEDSNEGESVNFSQTLKSQGYKNCITPINFTGFISTCAHGSGRSTTDRQFYFINSRPCEPVKVMKLINEIYRQYNPHQYPFVILNINLDQSSVDVNVTPDKRKVFFTKEKVLLEVLKSSLLKLFEVVPRMMKIEPTDILLSVKEDFEPTLDHPRIFNSFLQKFASKTSKLHVPTKEKKCKDIELKRKFSSILDYVAPKLAKIDSTNKDTTETINDMQLILQDEHLDKNQLTVNNYDINETVLKKEYVDNMSASKTDILLETAKHKEIMFLEYTDGIPTTQVRNIEDVLEEKPDKLRIKAKYNHYPISSHKTENNVKPKQIVTDKGDLGKFHRKSVVLKTSLEHVKALNDIFKLQNKKLTPERMKFKSKINPIFNKSCEEELSKEISKESFKKMNVIGQFNLGFIITNLNDDLFIIDQHATDEIYNFETLQKTTELTSQKLVIPQRLELSGVNEQLLMDNLPIFKKNGFTFEIDETALPTNRVKLLTIPMSKNWIFGKDDIDELLFMLQECPTDSCRPSRVRAMFASRACRKSVMIGTALSKSDMKVLVDHMAEIEHPWNCPHGRPTIRHLINLAMVQVQ